jgi:hypothetical protein
MKKSNKSSNAHGVDCVTFGELASRARWREVEDFFSDTTDPLDHIKVNERIDTTATQQRSNGPSEIGRPSTTMMPKMEFIVAMEQFTYKGKIYRYPQRTRILGVAEIPAKLRDEWCLKKDC